MTPITPFAPVPHDAWFTLREAAVYSKFGGQTLIRAIKAGTLKASCVGGRYRLRPRDIDAWLLERCTPKVRTEAELEAVRERMRRIVSLRWNRRKLEPIKRSA